MFVKPANMGSSIGISKVYEAEHLATAVAEASRFDEWILFEESIVGRELECGILGNLTPRASVVGEVRPGADFYDYDDRSEEHTSELQSLMRISYAVFCLTKKTTQHHTSH